VPDNDSNFIAVLPTVVGDLSRLAYARARASGIETEPLLKKAGLTDQQMNDPFTRITVRRQIRFLNLVADALQDELLGFHLAQTLEFRGFGLLYYVAASSETMGDALRRVARYCSITNEAVSLQYFGGPECKIRVRYVGVSRHLDRHQIEFFLTWLLHVCRQLTGQHVIPTSVRFAHHRSGTHPEVAAYFGGNVEFAAGTDELTFTSTAKDIKIVSADPYLNKLLVAQYEEALSRWPTKEGTFRAAVENAIAPLLPHGKANAAEIAKKLGLSQRTTARRLSSEGLSFSQVLEDLRSHLAKQYLLDQNLSISRIAWLLGYQEVSAFTHAFKRWTGETPRAARGDFGIPTRFCPAAAECPSIARPSAFRAKRGIRRPIRTSDESIARASARSSQGGPRGPAFRRRFCRAQHSR
jgi:AraC-like DNA-binding protein